MFNYGFHFGQPWWLAACVLLVPIVWMAMRNMTSLGKVRRWSAIILRCLVVLILIFLLARPTLTRKSKHLTLITVIDRSESIPEDLKDESLAYLAQALGDDIAPDKLAVVDVAEAARISKLPSLETDIRQRNTTLNGQQTKLEDGIQMAIAIAPPNSAVRILLVSEGNETAGDLKDAAQTAAANNIPIDVLPLQYQYANEVVFKRLVAPTKARSDQTISLRFILSSTTYSKGKLQLNLNDELVDLAPGSDQVTVPIELVPGTNVKIVSVPVGSGGIHEYEAIYIPDDASGDRISQNNRATAITSVTGPGQVLVVDSDGTSGQKLVKALEDSNIQVQYIMTPEFPDNLARLMDTDAIILANTDCSSFTFQQQNMICSYVNELGGGLVMTGGPNAFGAGGWIGSPVAEILPVDLDPPQQKQLPKGALVLIMHACEMPQGNYWGKMVASVAVDTLSRLDLVGILAYNWQGAGVDDWVYPFSEVGDKEVVKSAISQMQMGDMPSLHQHLQIAYDTLKDCDAGQKHVIVITDGDPQDPTYELLMDCKEAGITCTTVGIFPHQQSDILRLRRVADLTGGRCYDVQNPSQLPQIFIKEAQVVRRSLINEKSFVPQVVYSLSEITKGLSAALPNLDGYVITAQKGGLNQVILNSPEGDPVLAICQSGLGRCAVFTSSIDSRWASNWLQWGSFERFWEQTVRWAGKPSQSSDCEITADIQGKEVTVNVEAIDDDGKFIQLSSIDGQIIIPDSEASTEDIELIQIGPGQYSGSFEADASGSYIVNLRYKKIGDGDKTYITDTAVTIPFAPEFRDLSDNTPLLRQVSEMTGGRVLSSDPNQANLFDYEGVKFPETQMPLLKPLMFIWLALFLFDVAVRRLAFDFKAIYRRVILFVNRAGREAKIDTTLSKLKTKRNQVVEQMKSRSKDAAASKRYTADEKFTGDLPISKITDKKPVEPSVKKDEPKKDKKVITQEDSSHIQRLLKAKRKSGDQMKDN